MEDSIQLPSSEGQLQYHNQFPIQQIISPKGRRLTKGNNFNTASHQSLAYSNSTMNKNQLTERSPPLFKLDNTNNKNINTFNFRPFDKKQTTFGSKCGKAIEFDKIKQESYLSNFDDDNNEYNSLNTKQRIQLPCFLSNENSPNKCFQLQKQNDSLEFDNNIFADTENQKIAESKKYLKINPSNKKEIKDKILKSIKQNVEQKRQKNMKLRRDKKDEKQNNDITNLSGGSTGLMKSPIVSNKWRSNIQSKSNEKNRIKNQFRQIQGKNSNEKQNKSPLQSKRSKSPLQLKNNDQVLSLKQKIKQLEYSLQIQSISAQELKTKVNVLNQLLQQKFLQKNGINFKLFKNSYPTASKTKNVAKFDSKEIKDLTNVDLYVEMKIIQKAKQQLEISYQRLKDQLDQKSKESIKYIKKCQQIQKRVISLQRGKNQIKTQTTFTCSQVDRNKQSTNNENLNEDIKYLYKIRQLQEEREALIEYLQNQKRMMEERDETIKRLNQKEKELQMEIKQNKGQLRLLEEKQRRFTQIERPKLLNQLKDLTDKIDTHKQQIQRLQMENNLRQMKLLQTSFSGSKLKLFSNSYEQMPSNAKQQITSIQKEKQNAKTSQINDLQAFTTRNHANYNSIRSKQYQNQLSETGKQENCLVDQRASSKKIGILAIQDKQKVAPDAISLIMMQEQQLKLLKKERDYFRQQYESMKQLKRENYSLRMRNEDIENELNSLHQLIEIDEEVTF